MSCSPSRRVRAIHGRCRSFTRVLGLLALGLLSTAATSHAFLVSGFVRNAQGQGVAGVDIDAENALTGESVALSNDGTTATGSYAVFLPPGTYHLQFTPPAGQPLVGHERRNLVVMNQVSLNVTLQNGFFLFGTVRNPALQPIAGIDIDIRDQVTDVKLFVPHDNSDATGFYSVVVPAGTYKVLFRPNPSTSLPVRVFENTVMTQDRNLDCTLQSGVRLFGTATDPGHDPLAGVSLEVFNAVSGIKVWTFGSSSDQLGNYQVALLPGLSYRLEYSGPSGWGYSQTIVSSLFIASNTVRNVSMAFPFRLRGRVQTAQNGIPVLNVDIDVVQVASEHDIPLSNDATDSGGDYDVGVPGGLADVIFRSPEGNGLASSIIRNVNITDDTDLNALLPAGLTLTGRVRQPGGSGAANVDFDIESIATGLEVPVFDDDTDALGDYTLVLPAGSYRLDVNPGRGVRLVAQVLASVQVPHAGPLDVTLAPGVLLSGRVIDHISNPWEDVDLDVRIANTLNEIVTPGDDTNTNGDYMVTVPAGTYDLAFNVPPGIPVVGRVYEDVVVGPGDTVFDPVLSSTVVAVASEPAPGIPGLALANSPNPFYPSTRIGFTLSAAGPVTLRVYDVAGRMVSELLQDQWQGAGRHELQWDGRDRRGAAAASGIYFLRLETPLGKETRKITLTK
jgi:hypothetical protein